MSALYELTEEFNQALAAMQEQEFDEETISSTLDGMSIDLKEKIQNCAYVIKNKELFIGSVKSEIDRLTAMKKAREGELGRLKSYLLANMQSTGVDVKDSTLPVKLAKCPPSLNVVDESLIPRGYFVDQDPKLDRRTLLSDAKKKSVPGVELNKDNVRVKIG